MYRSYRATFAFILLSACFVGCVSEQASSHSTRTDPKVDLSAPVEKLRVVVTSYVPGCVMRVGIMPGLEERFDCLRCEILEPAALEGRRITFLLPNNYAHPIDLGLKVWDVVEIDLTGRSVTTDSVLKQIEMEDDVLAMRVMREKIKAAEPGATDNLGNAQ